MPCQGCWAIVSSLRTSMHWSVTVWEIGEPMGAPRICLRSCQWNTECVVVGCKAKSGRVSEAPRDICTFCLVSYHCIFSVLLTSLQADPWCTHGLPNLPHSHRPMHGCSQRRYNGSTPLIGHPTHVEDLWMIGPQSCMNTKSRTSHENKLRPPAHTVYQRGWTKQSHSPLRCTPASDGRLHSQHSTVNIVKLCTVLVCLQLLWLVLQLLLTFPYTALA